MTAIIFVYNADSGLLPGLKDFFHKVLSPSTYQCNLCAITYGATGMKPEWRAFIEGLSIPAEFLHEDELAEKYGMKGVTLPAVFVKTSEGDLEPWIDTPTMNRFASLDELMTYIDEHLAEITPAEAEELVETEPASIELD